MDKCDVILYKASLYFFFAIRFLHPSRRDVFTASSEGTRPKKANAHVTRAFLTGSLVPEDAPRPDSAKTGTGPPHALFLTPATHFRSPSLFNAMTFIPVSLLFLAFLYQVLFTPSVHARSISLHKRAPAVRTAEEWGLWAKALRGRLQAKYGGRPDALQKRGTGSVP